MTKTQNWEGCDYGYVPIWLSELVLGHDRERQPVFVLLVFVSMSKRKAQQLEPQPEPPDERPVVMTVAEYRAYVNDMQIRAMASAEPCPDRYGYCICMKCLSGAWVGPWR